MKHVNIFKFGFFLPVLVAMACSSLPATVIPPIPSPKPTLLPTHTEPPPPSPTIGTGGIEPAYYTPTPEVAVPILPPLPDSSVISPENVSQLTLLTLLPTLQDARLVWSADGTKFAVFHPFNNGEIRLYHLVSDSFDPVILTGYSQSVSAVAFSPDGAQLVSAGSDSTLRVWDVLTGKQIAELDLTPYSLNSAYVDTLTFAPDGAKLAVFMGVDSALHLFNFPLDNTAPTTLAWTEHASPVVGVYPSPDWQTFVWVGRGTLVLMNADGTFRGEQIGHEDFITNVLYSPDSQRLFIQTAQTINEVYSGVVIVYDVQMGQPLQTLAHPDFVTTSTLSPDAALLATSSANTVSLWDWATGTELLSIPDLPDVAQKLTFSPDGTLLVGMFNAGMIQVWDVKTGQAVASFQPGGELSGASFMLGGKVLAATQFDGTVLLMGVVP